MTNKGVFAFAGLGEHWKGEDGPEVVSATILTNCSNTLISRLHDRMPVII
ncbi:MAG: SOS response-associated peptidase [Desulfobulbaceae bacterium]|nr:SOS response-associated peptidase [Desulfobulbaceae bacterium]